MTDTFGPTDATSEQTKKQARNRTAKTHDPVSTTSPIREREPIVIVDEERDVPVSSLYSTVIFHPGERLKDKRLIELAKEHNIALRYK